VILDYVDFMVHVFQTHERDYYDLERLWADAPLLELNHILPDGDDHDEPAAAAEAP
jgi:ribosome-associated protein